MSNAEQKVHVTTYYILLYISYITYYIIYIVHNELESIIGDTQLDYPPSRYSFTFSLVKRLEASV